MSNRNKRELCLRNCTLENVINIVQEIGESVTISLRYLIDEYQQLQDRMKDGKKSGDSFYVRQEILKELFFWLSF